MAEIIDAPWTMRVFTPCFSASILSVTWVVAMKGSPGTRNTVLPFWAACRIAAPFSSSSSRLETNWTCLPHKASKRCRLKSGMRLVYVSMKTVSAVLVSSKPLTLMPFSSFNPKPTKTSSFKLSPAKLMGV